jgi:serine/threonine protein kinase
MLKIRTPKTLSEDSIKPTISANQSSSSSPRPLPNRLLFKGPLGGGRAGQVFLAITTDGRTVAVKVANRNDDDTGNEILALTRLQTLPPNPFIISLVGKVEYSADYAFIIMERCDADLQHVLRARELGLEQKNQSQSFSSSSQTSIVTREQFRSGLPEADALVIFRQIAKAVKHCHKKKVFHLDIKAENVLLKFIQTPPSSSSSSSSALGGSVTQTNGSIESSNITSKLPVMTEEVLTSPSLYPFNPKLWEIKLCDFGSASLQKSTSRASGSVSYAAPEVYPLISHLIHINDTPLPPGSHSSTVHAYLRMLYEEGAAQWNDGHPVVNMSDSSGDSDPDSRAKGNSKPYSTTIGDDADGSDDEIDRAHYEYDAAAADMWSLGVLLYVILVGSLPFEEASLHDRNFNSLWQGTHKLPDYLSTGARELLKGLLKVKPKDRFTIADVLRSPWVSPFPSSGDLNNHRDRIKIRNVHVRAAAAAATVQKRDPSRPNHNNDIDDTDIIFRNNSLQSTFPRSSPGPGLYKEPLVSRQDKSTLGVSDVLPNSIAPSRRPVVSMSKVTGISSSRLTDLIKSSDKNTTNSTFGVNTPSGSNVSRLRSNTNVDLRSLIGNDLPETKTTDTSRVVFEETIPHTQAPVTVFTQQAPLSSVSNTQPVSSVVSVKPLLRINIQRPTVDDDDFVRFDSTFLQASKVSQGSSNISPQSLFSHANSDIFPSQTTTFSRQQVLVNSSQASHASLASVTSSSVIPSSTILQEKVALLKPILNDDNKVQISEHCNDQSTPSADSEASSVSTGSTLPLNVPLLRFSACPHLASRQARAGIGEGFELHAEMHDEKEGVMQSATGITDETSGEELTSEAETEGDDDSDIYDM